MKITKQNLLEFNILFYFVFLNCFASHHLLCHIECNRKRNETKYNENDDEEVIVNKHRNGAHRDLNR